MITERQAQILETIIQEYIKSVKPVSSEFLEKKYDFGVSPATIRNEMQELTKKGYIFQPHISAGRVPTDKGYRFFVDKILERGVEELNFEEKIEDWIEEEFKNEILFLQKLTKNIAQFSRTLVLSYLEKEKIFWKEGWEEVLKEPEFKDENFTLSFAEFLKDFEEEIDKFKLNSSIKIYIGRENPIKRTQNFSLILSRCCFGKTGNTIFSLFGPIRMDYNKNIGLIKALKEFLEKL